MKGDTWPSQDASLFRMRPGTKGIRIYAIF